MVLIINSEWIFVIIIAYGLSFVIGAYFGYVLSINDNNKIEELQERKVKKEMGVDE